MDGRFADALTRLPDYLGFMAREMANPATVVPIGSAMGFSYVLRLTGCDQHLIHLLLRPLRRVRPLLVPGGILAGYLVNTTLVSQTSAAAVVGPILIPLLIAGGIPAPTAGAVLLLGCSMGGAVVRDFHLDRVESRTPARQARLHLRLQDGYADCARYCAGLVLTATPDDWAAVRLRGPLSFAYPLVRAMRVARRHAFTLRRAEGGS